MPPLRGLKVRTKHDLPGSPLKMNKQIVSGHFETFHTHNYEETEIYLHTQQYGMPIINNILTSPRNIERFKNLHPIGIFEDPTNVLPPSKRNSGNIKHNSVQTKPPIDQQINLVNEIVNEINYDIRPKNKGYLVNRSNSSLGNNDKPCIKKDISGGVRKNRLLSFNGHKQPMNSIFYDGTQTPESKIISKRDMYRTGDFTHNPFSGYVHQQSSPS